jgi:mono/diheme cytochrome c family protein
MPRFPGFILLLILAALLSACSFSLAADITPPPGSELPASEQSTQSVAASPVYPIVPPDLVNGKKLYNQECVQCHGVQGMGDGPQAAQLSVPVATLGLSDFARLYSPAEWYTVVTQGNMEKFMPAFANLTDRQRWDVVAYAISLSAPDILISQGKAIYQQKCITCHGQSGNGNGPDASTLSTSPKNFTDQAFMAQSSSASLYQAISAGITPDMPAYTGTLNDNERWALTAYLRSLTFAVPQSTGNTYPAPSTLVTAKSTSNAYPAAEASPNPVLTQTPQLSSTAEVTPTVTFLGSVTVQLINGSGGDAPSDAPVTLYGFDNMQNTYSETLSSGENGVYTFTNVIMPEGRVFLAGTDYASGTYGSDIVTVDPATPNLSLQITVYESTTDVSLLTTDRVHIFFDFTDPQNVQVIEVFIISNPTKQSIVAPTQDGTVVTFPLPQGYTKLQFQEGELGIRYEEVSQGFADKMTVNPGAGQYQVIFAFQMPYDHKLNFVQPMFLPTSAVVVLVPDNGVKVNSPMLQDGGTQDISGSSYRMYNGSSLIAGSSLEFTLSGNPKKATTSIFTTGTMQNMAIGLGVFGLVLVLVGLWLFRRYQRKLALQRSLEGMDMAASPIEVYATPEDEGTLMDAIIALDDQYHAGNLPEEAYLERRAVLKEKLRKLEQG